MSYFPIFCSPYRKTLKDCLVFMNLISVFPSRFSWIHKKIRLFCTISLMVLGRSKKASVLPIPESVFSLYWWVTKCLSANGKTRRFLSKMGQVVTSSFLNCFLDLTWGTRLLFLVLLLSQATTWLDSVSLTSLFSSCISVHQLIPLWCPCYSWASWTNTIRIFAFFCTLSLML